MAFVWSWWIFTFSWIFCWAVATQPLNGRNIRVLPLPTPTLMAVERNASGHIVSMSGLLYSVIESLSENLNFTIEIDHTEPHLLFDTPTTKGLLSSLQNKVVDMLLGPLILVSTRLELMDFPYAFMLHVLDLVMPMPSMTVYGIAAIWKPLQPAIWGGFLISLLLMVAFFVHTLKESPSYILEVMLSQGGSIRCQTMNHYLLAGSWCLGCFVLVTAYSSVLVSFITAPIYHPLVNSVYDLVDKTDVYPVFESGKVVDILLKDIETEVGKKILKKVNRDLNLRCKIEEECMDKVRAGNCVLIQTETVSLDVIGREYKRTGRCEFSLIKERMMRFMATVALAKNSPYTDTISKELLKMEAAGLFDLWWKRAAADPTRCLDEARFRPANPRLSRD